MGYLSKGEVQISTIPRAYAGRGGSMESTTYMGSPLTVAASAINGKITSPENL
jgi:3-isopropylmalate/(R)-2-methylmalate dehydratase large subunit